MPLDALPRPDLIALLELADDSVTRGIEPFLERALILCAEWFRASGATLFLREDEGTDYALAARAGIDGTVPLGATIRHGQGIAGTAAETGEPMLLTDPSEHAQLAGRIHHRRREIGSSMVIPLRTRHFGPLGVLCLSRRADEEEFSQKDLSVARSVAGQVALAVANARLYNQAMEAVAEARALHDKLEAVVDCLGVAVLVVDRQGRLAETNREAAELIGRAPHGQEDWTQYVEAGPSGLAASLVRALDRSLDGTREEIRASDTVHGRTWSIVASPMPEGGAAIAIQDITASERAERELRETRRMAEIGQMTSAIAHEIRNPLTGIRGAAQMVCEAGGEAHEFGEIIREETDKLDRLCGEFLEFARPFELHRREVSLTELIARVVDLNRPEFQGADVELDLVSSEDLPMISLDPSRIEQVARNLLRNALQASSRGGRVQVRVGEAEFEVRDEGIGMTSEQVANLFVPFFTTKPQGTGLGLSVVKKIVDAHQGTIEVTSQPGKGTCFLVRIGREN